VQDEIKKMSLKKETTKEKEHNHRDYDKKVHENKCAIVLDNIAMKLGVKDKSDIVNVLKSKLEYLKTHNMPKYLELMGQKQESTLNAWILIRSKTI